MDLRVLVLGLQRARTARPIVPLRIVAITVFTIDVEFSYLNLGLSFRHRLCLRDYFMMSHLFDAFTVSYGSLLSTTTDFLRPPEVAENRPPEPIPLLLLSSPKVFNIGGLVTHLFPIGGIVSTDCHSSVMVRLRGVVMVLSDRHLPIVIEQVKIF